MSWHTQSHGYKLHPVYYRAQACPPPGYGERNYHYDGPSCTRPIWDRSEGMQHFYGRSNGYDMFDPRKNAGAASMQMRSQGEVPFGGSIEDREFQHQIGRKNPTVDAFAGIHHTRFME